MAITIERQLPERGERGAVAAPAGQCCCCCCCCLHSLGGMVGAFSARSTPVDPGLPTSATDRRTLEPRHSASGLYWAITAIMTGLLSAYLVASDGYETETNEVSLILAVVFPAVQLAASLATAMVIALSRRVGKEERMRHLGKITLRAFLGAAIGALFMLMLFPLFK